MIPSRDFFYIPFITTFFLQHFRVCVLDTLLVRFGSCLLQHMCSQARFGFRECWVVGGGIRIVCR